MHIEGLSPKEPYISHLNESALPIFQGEQRATASVEGEMQSIYPSKIVEEKKDLCLRSKATSFKSFPK